MVVYSGVCNGKSKGRGSKKGVRTEYDGILFDSLIERDFYKAVRKSECCDTIQVHKQLRFHGTARGLEIDFILTRKDGVVFYVDTKSFWTISKTFTFKKQILEQQMGIRIDIVLKNRESKNREAIDEIDLYVEYISCTESNIGFATWKKIRRQKGIY